MILECKWKNTDCKNIGDICNRCLLTNQFYIPKTAKKGLRQKANPSVPDGRMGSKFEFKNHKENEALVSSSMTLNSGATGKEKGDEQIRGIIEIMEELKTQMPDRAKGTKSFAIKRKWLDKLHSEAEKENKEFWYLKFAFDENETVHAGGNTFIIVEQDIIMSMVKTMIEDRKKAKKADAEIDMYKKLYMDKEAECIFLKSQIEKLKAVHKYIKIEDTIKHLFNYND